MYIDCHSCPGRQVACDGCMMQVLFDPVSSANDVLEGDVEVTARPRSADAEIGAAIDVFASAAMVSSSAALSARNAIRPVHKGRGGSGLAILRAG
jgi:hypothetical protein